MAATARLSASTPCAALIRALDQFESATAEQRAILERKAEAQTALDALLSSCDPDAEVEFANPASEEELAASVVHVQAHHRDSTGVGTGFIIDVRDCYAYVLTARHVLHDGRGVGESFSVCRSAGECVPADLVYFFSREQVYRDGIDIASVRFPCATCKALRIAEEPERLQTTEYLFRTYWAYPRGVSVTAMAYPALDEGVVVLAGETLGNRMVEEHEPLSDALIEHDVYLRPGASGSPLLNAAGYVIGMNISTLDTGISNARYLDLGDSLIRNILQRSIDGD